METILFNLAEGVQMHGICIKVIAKDGLLHWQWIAL